MQVIPIVEVGESVVNPEVVYSVLDFVVLYAVTSLALTGATTLAGLDLEFAIGAVVATVNRLGPGLGEVKTNFVTVGSAVKWLAVVGMRVGRLEVFTVLILFTPSFWRN